MGARESVKVSLEVEISANNLRIPVRSIAEIDIAAITIEVTVAELIFYADGEYE